MVEPVHVSDVTKIIMNWAAVLSIRFVIFIWWTSCHGACQDSDFFKNYSWSNPKSGEQTLFQSLNNCLCLSLSQTCLSIKLTIEPHRDKANKMACAPSEDSDQPGHPPSLIRVFDVRLKKARMLSYPLSGQRRLWTDWEDAQADLSLRWAHMPFLSVLSRGGSILCQIQLKLVSFETD